MLEMKVYIFAVYFHTYFYNVWGPIGVSPYFLEIHALIKLGYTAHFLVFVPYKSALLC